MRKVTTGQPATEVYFDDILVQSESEEAHIKDCDTFFASLQEWGLTINVKKSKMFVVETEYLGYNINSEGIRPSTAKVDAIVQLKAPKNVKEVRQFVGLVNFIRRHLPHLSQMLSPITSLMSPKVPFYWNAKCIQAFEQVKKAVVEAVMLHHPDFNLPFDVYTDASLNGYAAVIMQKEFPIVFFSRKFHGPEMRYSTIKRELWAILTLFREYRHLLLGQRIVVHTDHKNLLAEEARDATVLRWQLEIAEFGAEYRFIAGVENTAADALSRLDFFTPNASCDDLLVATLEAPEFPLHFKHIAKAQKAASTIPDPIHGNSTNYGGHALITHRGHIVLPASIVPEVMDWFHQSLMHPGSTRMAKTICRSFYWKNLWRDVLAFVKTCKPCQMNKSGGRKYAKLPLAPHESVPWSSVRVDIIGFYNDKAPEEVAGRCALSIIEPVFRWVELVTLPNKTSETVAKAFDETWLCRYPRPERCIHDQGLEFTGQAFSELLDSYGIDNIKTPVRNPEANGILERIHRVLGDAIRTSESDDVHWSGKLQAIAWTLRTAYNRVLGCSPGELVFRRDMIMPHLVEIDLNSILARKSVQMRYDNARENAKRIHHEYVVGDMVLLANDAGVLGKLKVLWLGPFKIIQVMRQGLIRIQRDRYTEIVTLRRVKPFRA
jgi:hypothetical protein